MLEVDVPMPLLVSIVDDDSSVCEGLSDLLHSMGFAAETFQSADDFLKSDQIDSASVLISDMQMPGMTGLELHEHLAKSGKNIPTILITAFPKDGDRSIALRTGVSCYLKKPFSEEVLLTSIRSALGAGDAGEIHGGQKCRRSALPTERRPL
jgi:FixJ family two-component response regulator